MAMNRWNIILCRNLTLAFLENNSKESVLSKESAPILNLKKLKFEHQLVYVLYMNSVIWLELLVNMR